MAGTTRALASALPLVLAAVAMPGASRDLPPEGWFRHEHDTSGINEITLTYRAGGTDHVAITFECSRNFSEVDFRYKTEDGAPTAEAPRLVRLENEAHAYAVEVAGTNAHVLAGKVTFDPTLSALLTTDFVVTIDGLVSGRYTAEGGQEAIAATIVACQDR